LSAKHPHFIFLKKMGQKKHKINPFNHIGVNDINASTFWVQWTRTTNLRAD
jgi:hypothetical protein